MKASFVAEEIVKPRLGGQLVSAFVFNNHERNKNPFHKQWLLL